MNQNIFPLEAVNLQVLVNVPNLEVTTLEFCVGLEYLFIQPYYPYLACRILEEKWRNF
jgi:hypothetical protein